jgi:hypothetical protein
MPPAERTPPFARRTPANTTQDPQDAYKPG